MTAMPPCALPMVELAEVIDVADPEGLSRVQVRFLQRGPASDSGNNTEGQDLLAWALVAVPFAGDNMGAFMIPDVGARVVVGCLNNDPRYPVVLGSVWDGSTAVPEELPGNEVDRWTMTGKAGTRVAIVEESGQSKIELESANGRKVVIDDSAGHIKLSANGSTVTMTGSEISMSASTVKIEATQFEVSAPMATYDCVLSDFSGFIFCDLMQSNTVVSTTYTPGAGNIL